MNNDKIVGLALPWLIAISAFSLALHSDQFHPKPFDVIALATGVLALTNKDIMENIIAVWPRIKYYLRYFLILVVGLVVAQVAQVGSGGIVNPGPLFVNYARVFFNFYALLLFAVLTLCARSRSLASWAILISPVLALPALLGDYREGVLIDGGRLAGFFQTPILFTIFAATAFLIGLGVLLDSEKRWQRLILSAWLAIIANFILWSASRPAWLSLAACLLLWFFRAYFKKDYRVAKYIILVPLTTFFVGYLLLPNSEYLKIKPWVERRAVTAVVNPLANQAHTKIWPRSLNDVMSNPLGLGLDRRTSASTNTFLEVWLGGGIIALVAFSLILTEIGRDVRIAMAASEYSSLSNLETSLLLVAVVFAINIFFTDAFLLRYFWAIGGIVLGVCWQKRLLLDAGQK